MELVAYPDEVRTMLADLHLLRERGQITVAQEREATDALIAGMRKVIPLDETWHAGPTPPEPHNPRGRQMVFWRGRSEAEYADAISAVVASVQDALEAT